MEIFFNEWKSHLIHNFEMKFWCPTWKKNSSINLTQLLSQFEKYGQVDDYFIFKYLKNLKIFLSKKRRFRLRWDSRPGLSIAGRLLYPLSYTGVRHLLLYRKTSLYRLVALACVAQWLEQPTGNRKTGARIPA